MGTTRKRLVAAVASLAAAAFVAGCGGDSGSGNGPSDQSSQSVSAKVDKGGTVYSLEQSVTQSLDPQRTYEIQSSPDLLTWQTVGVISGNSTQNYNATPEGAGMFFRLRRLPD